MKRFISFGVILDAATVSAVAQTEIGGSIANNESVRWRTDGLKTSVSVHIYHQHDTDNQHFIILA